MGSKHKHHNTTTTYKLSAEKRGAAGRAMTKAESAAQRILGGEKMVSPWPTQGPTQGRNCGKKEPAPPLLWPWNTCGCLQQSPLDPTTLPFPRFARLWAARGKLFCVVPLLWMNWLAAPLGWRPPLQPQAFPLWIVGVILAFLGCVLSNLGVNLQKLCHDRATAVAAEAAEQTRLNPLLLGTPDIVSGESPPNAKPPKPPPVYCNPLWLLGLICIAVGSVMDLCSFAFAPLSLLAPLGALVGVTPTLAGVPARNSVCCPAHPTRFPLSWPPRTAPGIPLTCSNNLTLEVHTLLFGRTLLRL